jgi:hypothetical protein
MRPTYNHKYHALKLFVRCLTLLLLLTNCSSNHIATHTTEIKTTSDKAISNKTADIKTQSNKKILALLQDSKNASSLPDLEKMIHLAAQNTNAPEPLFDIAYVHLRNYQTHRNKHEHDLAIAYFTEVLLLVPGNQAVVQALYNIYYDDTLHNYSPTAFAKATEYFLQVPELGRAKMNPPSLAHYVATALQQESQHQTDQQTLRIILLRAIQEQPKNDYTYIQLAKLYSSDRYFSLALATLKLGAENITDSADLYNAIASTYEKRANKNNCNYEHPSDIANAAKYYKLAISLTPDDTLLHYSLSSTFFDQNLYRLGLNESDIVLALDSSKTNLSNSAQNYSMFGQQKKANELLQRALSSGLALNDLSHHEIAMNQGDWAKAAKSFSAYIKTRDDYSLYDLMKSDIIAQEMSPRNPQPQSWIINKKINLTSDWEEALFQYWTKKISADELKKVALNNCEKTEYYFYTGYKDYRNGQTAQAKIKFSEALKQNTYRFIERPLARYFLMQ